MLVKWKKRWPNCQAIFIRENCAHSVCSAADATECNNSLN